MSTSSTPELPSHLKKYVVKQNYSRYTPINQSVWRYILRQLVAHLSSTAHSSYIEGLKKTGINTEEIPRIEEMSQKLEEFGWRAVPVSGFIPPAAFMEFQALGFLPIASDMRSIDHIFYTPAPDIVHEAAGHAPIISDPDYADYLKKYAVVARKALISKEDLNLYEAIRIFSDIKEDPSSTTEDISSAENKLATLSKNISFNSEASLLSRMNWWTAEYGLIGPIDNPKIFGAGLLSSIGESDSCFAENVEKIPFSLDCLDFSYDITEPQPQLFVCQDFRHLKTVLEDFSETMAYKKGGVFAVKKGIQSQTVNTAELSSGLQISGLLDSFKVDSSISTEQPFYIRFSGPSQLSLDDKQLPGHSKNFHSAGYSTVLGKLKDGDKPLEDFTEEDLISAEIIIGKISRIHFASGVTLKGKLKQVLHNPKNNKLVLLTFEDCTVSLKSSEGKEDEILFHPDWGMFDLGVGETVTSVFAGPVDRQEYGDSDAFVVQTIPLKNYSDEEKKKHSLYQDLRQLRGSVFNQPDNNHSDALSLIEEKLKDFPNEWLAHLEYYEVLSSLQSKPEQSEFVLQRLKNLADNNPEISQSINKGLKVANESPLIYK